MPPRVYHTGLEIERRFLLRNDGWRTRAGKGTRIRQGYIAIGDTASVRIRTKGKSRATLTIKSRTGELRRSEFEYAIPHKDAVALLSLCGGSIIEKVRYRVRHHHLTWEVDVFEGRNEGLIIAEIELRHEKEPVQLPEWLGREITAQDRYSNTSLAVRPYSSW